MNVEVNLKNEMDQVNKADVNLIQKLHQASTWGQVYILSKEHNKDLSSSQRDVFYQSDNKNIFESIQVRDIQL